MVSFKMYKIFYFIFSFAAYLVSAQQITPCASDDSACLISAIKDGVLLVVEGSPELEIEPLDPMKVALIESNKNGLNLVFKDTVVTGLKKCDVTKATYDEANKKQSVSLKCSVTLNGLYKVGGKLLIVPIEGEGKYNIEIVDIVIDATLDVETITGKDGQPHWHVTNLQHSFKLPARATFRLENLFNGNEKLSAAALEFANSNSQDVIKEVGPDVVAAIAAKVADHIDSVYNVKPIATFIKS